MFASLRQSRFYPLLLLFATGTTLGLSTPFAKVALDQGISPVAFAFWQNLIGGLLLLVLACATGSRPVASAQHLRFFLISGFITLALPHVLIFLAVARIGAGLPSVAYAFPTLLTYSLALLLGMEKLVWRRAAGIGLGLVGILLILVPRSGPVAGPDLPWMLLAFIAPVALAIGNIYRTRAWPQNAAPLLLAAGTLLAAALWLLLAGGAMALVSSSRLYLPGRGETDWVLPVAGVFACMSFISYFELQRVAGPVYLSQIGYVITTTSLMIGAFHFGESYSLLVWGALLVIIFGILLVNQRPSQR